MSDPGCGFFSIQDPGSRGQKHWISDPDPHDCLLLLFSLFSDEQVGKLVVATNSLEEERLLDLWERANHLVRQSL